MVNPIGGPSPTGDNNPLLGATAGDDYNTGVQDLQNGDYTGAYNNLLAASQDKVFSKQNPQVFYYMGLSAEYSGASGLTPDAKECFKNYLQQPNTDPSLVASAKGQICMVDAQTALNNNDYETALKNYEQAGVDDPSLVPQLAKTVGQIKGQIDINKANAAQAANDTAGMLKWYQQAAIDDPDMGPQLAPTIQQLQGQIQWNNEQPAINDLTNQAQNVMYPPYQEQSDPRAAIAILQSAIAQYPDIEQNDPSIYYTMAQYAWSAGDVDQAREYFGKFAPSISSIPVQGNEDFLKSVANFSEQLGGGTNAVMSNWATYGANVLGKSKYTDWLGGTNWFQNNVLSAAQGIMPSGGDHQTLDKIFKDSQLKPLKRSLSIHGDSDQMAALDEQETQLKADRSQTNDPKKRGEIDSQLETIQQQRTDFELAQRDRKSVKSVQSDADKATGTETTRSYGAGMHWTSTEETKNASHAAQEHVGKGEGSADDPSGPGFWNLGTTLARAQATYKTFGTVNNVVLASGGKGISNYQISASGGANALNAEARTFQMVYGGGTNAGAGYQNMYGAQARADLLDEDYSLNYAGGDTSIGGQDFSVNNNNALATGQASESVALGATQADAHGALALGTQGVHLGGSGGAFAGAAQASSQVAGSVLGQGGFAMGQAWVGAGVKAHASVGLGLNGIHFDLGLGAALGVGGYIQVSGNINLEAAGQSIAAIYGTGDHTIKGMAGRTVELAASAGAAVSEMASHVAGGIDNAIGNAQDYFSEHAGDNLLHADNVGQFAAGVGEEAGQIATDAMDATLKPTLEAVKEVGHVASEVGSDIAKGKIGDAIEETVEGGAKAAWNGVKDLGESAVHGIKDFFHGW